MYKYVPTYILYKYVYTYICMYKFYTYIKLYILPHDYFKPKWILKDEKTFFWKAVFNVRFNLVKWNILFSVSKCLLVGGFFFGTKRSPGYQNFYQKKTPKHYEKLTSYHKDFSRKELHSRFIKDWIIVSCSVVILESFKPLLFLLCSM